MYPENPEGNQVIVGSMNMEYISDTARNRTHNLFRPKWEPIPLGHSVDSFGINLFLAHLVFQLLHRFTHAALGATTFTSLPTNLHHSQQSEPNKKVFQKSK